MKVGLLLFTIGLALGLYLSFMYSVASRTDAKPPVPVVPARELQKEVTSSERAFAGKMDSLQSENKKLAVNLDKTKAELQKAKARSLALEQRTKRLIKQNNEAQESPYAYNASCDSLIGTVEALMQASAQKDSLYEGVVSGLEVQVANRDSAIALGVEQYQSLKATFDKSLQNQSLLETQNTTLTKTVKRQRVKSKFVSALLFIVTGIAASQIIQR